ncbi:MAG: efflux RND transporter permease subunit [Solirubrobacterales bacterium]
MSEFFSRVAAAAASRRAAVVTAAILLAVIGVVAALRLETDASTATLVDRGSETFEATEKLKQEFGDDAITVLVQSDGRHDLQDIMLTEDLGQLLRLEGCLAGATPAGEEAAAPACAELARSDAVRVVYGPATFLNQAVAQAERFLNEQSEATLAEARATAAGAVETARAQGLNKGQAEQAGLSAGQAVLGEFQNRLLQIAVRYGQTGLPSIDDPQFVSQVVFDNRLGAGEPKSRFAYLFPSPESALISVRLQPGLSGEERDETIALIREATGETTFALESAGYSVSGVPVVVQELGGEFRGEIFVLLAAALVVMALVLTLVFGPPLRLLPLLLALIASAVTFGVLSLTGGSLTMASIAVLPVLIGLAVDYSIQFQARFREAIAADEPALAAARTAASRGGPVIATAALATAAGFLVLLLSPVPMVRGFGVLLVVGIFFALVAALTVGFALLVGASARGEPRTRTPARLTAAGKRLRASGPAQRVFAARAAAGDACRRLTNRALAISVARPGRVLLVAAVLAVAGWVAGTRTEVVSDLRELVPAAVLERAGVDEIQDETGVSGELNVIVEAEDLTDPAVVAWMADLKQRVLQRGGFGGEFPSCEAAQVCPQIALSDLFTDGSGALDKERIETILDAVPPYFSQAVITREDDGALGNVANIAFGIRVMPLEEQKTLVDAIRAEIDPAGSANDPPPGVDARVAGLPALVADANAELSDSRYLLTIAGLLAVAFVLLAVYRSLNRALVPLVPIALAIGWSALVLWAMGVPLNPMSATLGALVIAIATEFSVILSARFREERRSGLSLGEALRRTYARTGTAVLASGVTAIAGFAVLALSDIRMLRDFGLVTVVDLGVALVGVMIVLPAALVFAESRAVRTRSAGATPRRLIPAKLRR